MTSGELASAARGLLLGRGRGHENGRTTELRQGKTNTSELPGIWPQAVAFLARQALEHGLDDFWSAVAPLVRGVSRQAQLLCLDAFIADGDVVSGVRHAWHGLSRACHHHVYELPPTEGELGMWLDAVDRLLAHDPTRS